MTERPTFIYSSETTPKLLRPAKPGEDHIWLHPDGRTLKLEDGQWVEHQPDIVGDA